MSINIQNFQNIVWIGPDYINANEINNQVLYDTNNIRDLLSISRDDAESKEDTFFN